MIDGDIREAVWAVLRTRAPQIGSADSLDDRMALGGDGLGLDSIAIAEVLLDLQDQFGLDVQRLMDGEPVTFGRLTTLIGDARRRA